MSSLGTSDVGHLRRLVYLAIIVLLNSAGFFYYLYYFIANGYLPSPFIYDKSDTFMDLFNPMYWAYDDGRYIDWGSVYPPLNFLILRVFNFICAGSTFGDPALMRDDSSWVIVGLILLYFAVPVILLKIRYWKDFSKYEKFLIYFAIVLSSPMLFTLERGNIIFLAPVFLALAISKIGRARSFSIAFLINIKPYFALILIYYIVRMNWKGLVTTTLISGSIFLITGLALDNHFLVFFKNIFNYSQGVELYSLREVMALPSSLSAFSYVLKHPDGANFATSFLRPESIATTANLIEALKWGVLAISLVVLCTRSKQVRDAEIFVLLVVFISNLGVWVGGYTYILYMALVPVVITMRNKQQYLYLLALIALPLDVIPILGDYIGVQYSYLASDHVEILWTLGLGSVIRPIVNITLLALLTYEFIARKKSEIASNNAFHIKSFSDNDGLTEKT